MIWVIGGGGLVGEGLKSQKWNAEVRYFSSRDYDINNCQQFGPISCDTVVDLVPSPFVSINETNEEDYHQKYTDPHIKFISKALLDGVKNYIFVSSGGSIYGHIEKGTRADESFPTRPVSNYGKSKLKIENALTELSTKHQTRYIILRPGNVFNENFQSSLQKGLIGALVNCVKMNNVFSLFGKTEISKDYISNGDVGSAIIKAAHSDLNGVFNIGLGEAYSILEIIEMFEKKFSKKILIEYKPALQADIEWTCLNTSQAENLLKYKPKKTLPCWINSIRVNEF